jgi:tRNA U34 5-methylaminomethyl-2-thiouridine-forming methyltransferase MnmC
LEHPIFEIVTTTCGAISIRNKVVNEIMHNPVGPWPEANALYIDQSGLKNHLAQETQDEFVLFDVGLGAAANALAALHCAAAVGPARPFRIVSFEKDTTLLHFALDHASQFDHFRGYEQAIKSLLNQGSWSSGLIHWELRDGDFLELIQKEAYKPHLIFFDPYSPKVNQEMWTSSSFRLLHDRSRTPAEGGTSLFTYSLATKIRAAMIDAGFCVGYGEATGLKAETTQAATQLSLLKRPLDMKWFERWKKSHSRYPFDCRPEDQGQMDQKIESYRQSFMQVVAPATL